MRRSQNIAIWISKGLTTVLWVSQGGHLLEYLHNTCLRKSNTSSSHMQLYMAIDPFSHT